MFKVLAALCGLWFGLFSSVCSAQEWDVKHILVLHSYEPSYQWTADFQKGIDEALSLSQLPIKMSIEYLDTKRINSPQYYQALSDYFSAKYASHQFDGVIATDDNAVTLLNMMPNLISRQTPIVAVGVNDTDANLYQVTDRATMLYENDHIDKNIQLINDLRPKIKNLYFLNDDSVTSEHIRHELYKAMTAFPHIKVIEIREDSLALAKERLETIDANDAVLLTHFNTELNQGIYHSYQQIADTVSDASKAPVFALWEFLITGEVLGGYVNHSKSIGTEAVVALDKYLPLNLSEPIDVGDSKRFVFNFNAIKKLSLFNQTLPENALLINEPRSFFREHFRLLVALTIVIAGLSIIVLMQYVTIRQKRELAKKNKRILALQKQTMSVQKDMIHVLGEAIETRSGETGNHVKRVAKLSALLAKHCGLSHREQDVIEIISPMHDVGKISVPEAILDKPGKLTPSEWEIMKQHTTAGYKLLKSGSGDLTNLAAIIANEHHERWDGKGYPVGKQGEEIHLFARITTVADVFDALLSARCYKEAWSIGKVKALFEREAGLQFDPKLVEHLLNNIDQYIAIRDQYPDSH